MARNLEFDEDIVIEKAMYLFWKKGYTATSLRDLTHEMKINSSSLYKSIGDKQVLFVKCLEKYIGLRTDRFLSIQNSKQNAMAKLQKFILDTAQSICQTPVACMAIKTAFELADSDLAIHQVLKNYEEFILSCIQKLLNEAKANGDLREDLDAGDMALFIMNNTIGWYENYIINRDKAKILSMAKFLIRQIN